MFNFYMRAGLPRQLNRIQNTQQKPDSGIITMCALNNDCFVKRPYTGLEPSKEFRIETLFDETYDEVLKDTVYANPIAAELNLPRPALKTAEYTGDDGAASYNFADNEMTFSEHYDKDLYLLTSRDKETGALLYRAAAAAEELEEGIKTAQNAGGEFDIFKFTPDEKDFMLKASIAHELRHYIQHHLIASAEDIGDELHDKYYDIFLNAQEIQDNYIESCKKSGIKPDKSLLSRRMPDYWDTYKPQSIIERGTLLKFSSSRKDKRCLALDDIMAGINEGLMYGRYGGGNYYARPSEIDAYNYEYEYIKKFASVHNVRKEIADYLADTAQEKCEEGINRMKKSGGNFIEAALDEIPAAV